MPSAPLTLEERSRVRVHLGYPNVSAISTFTLGNPAAIETTFIIEGAMNKVLDEATGEVRRHLAILDGVLEQMLADQELLAVTKVDEIDIRQDEFAQLVRQYMFWRSSLGNVFGVGPNPFDQRFSSWAGGGMGSLNVTVQH